jgi:hypothetical protein
MFVGIDDTSGIGKHCRLLHLRCHLNDKMNRALKLAKSVFLASNKATLGSITDNSR